MSQTYFDELPEELLFTIVNYITKKRDFDIFISIFPIFDNIETWNRLCHQFKCPLGKENYMRTYLKTELYGFGHNIYGCLGIKRSDEFEKPFILDWNIGIIRLMACGRWFTVLINTNNEIYVLGSNNSGRLGLGDMTNRNIPTKITDNFGHIVQVSCGAEHMAILNDKGELFTCGYNCHGQLGHDGQMNTWIFIKVEGNFGRIIQVSCGYFHTIFLTNNNELYYMGQLTHKVESVVPKRFYRNLGIITKISCGEYNSAILNTKGELFYLDSPKLPITIKRISQMASGQGLAYLKINNEFNIQGLIQKHPFNRVIQFPVKKIYHFGVGFSIMVPHLVWIVYGDNKMIEHFGEMIDMSYGENHGIFLQYSL